MNKEGSLWLMLDTESRTRLCKQVPPTYPVTFYEHVTLMPTTAPDARVLNLLGEICTIEAYEECWNDKVQAVRIRTEGLPDTYGVPHVTLSTDGTEPFSSVEMLKTPHESRAIEPAMRLRGIVRFVV